MPRLSVVDLAKRFLAQDDSVALAVQSTSFTVDSGESLTLVGPSGSGKTTTLRLIAGLETPDAGRILLNDTDITATDAGSRPVAMVFQSLALLPHLDVAGNIALPLQLRSRDTASTNRETHAMASRLGIATLLDRMPNELSGGELQRVALARALLQQPQILLLDEPFTGLDAPLRTELRHQLRQLRSDLGFSVVHVTHDQAEALASGDRIAVLRAGCIEQCAPPDIVYAHPATRFVAGFIGLPPMNFVPGRIEVSPTGPCFLPDAAQPNPLSTLALGSDARHLPPGPVLLGVRPENVGSAGPGAPGWPFVVQACECTGPDWIWDGTLAGHPFRVRRPQRCPSGTAIVAVNIPAPACRFFDPVSGVALKPAS